MMGSSITLDLDFSEHGPVIKDALGWVEYKIVDLPKDIGDNHLMVIGEYSKVKVNPKFNEEISPIDKPKAFIQWERNNFAEASDIFSIDPAPYYANIKHIVLSILEAIKMQDRLAYCGCLSSVLLLNRWHHFCEVL